MSLPDIPPSGDADVPLAARMLVSDADRARVADVIGEAYAEGRLTREEHEERLEVAMSARTVTDFGPVLEGLPPAAAAAALAPLTGLALPAPMGMPVVQGSRWSPAPGAMPASSSVVAIFGGATRKGEWVVPVQMTTFAMFGGIELDLTHATFDQMESTIVAVAVMGGVEITVPPGLTVHVDGMGIFGGFDQRAEGPGEPGSPVLHIKGLALFGGVDVRRTKRRKRDRELRRGN